MRKKELVMGTELAISRPELALLDEWKSALANDANVSEASRETYTKGAQKFLDWAQKKKVQNITKNDIERWKSELRAKHRPTTVNTWLSGVRRFLSWIGQFSEDDNPLAEIKNIERPGANKSHLRDPLTDDEILRVLSLPNRSTPEGKRDYAYLCIRAYTGMRDVELQRADFDDLSYIDGLPIIRIRGKGREDTNRIAVVYGEQAQLALQEWLDVRGKRPGALITSLSDRSKWKRLSMPTIRSIVKGYLRAAGINDRRKTSHSFRHSAITKVALVNPVLAQILAGHSDLNTTMIYVHEAQRLINPGEQFIKYG
jgi:integrase/recombinase XerD